MIVDKPLLIRELLAEEDEAERAISIINTIVDLVQSNPGGSVCISISGDWGSGKTTCLKMLESYFLDYLGYPVVFYEAWKNQEDDHPLIPLITRIKEMPNLEGTWILSLDSILSTVGKSLKATTAVLSDIFLRKVGA